jgi:hypothetical protein
MEQVAALVPEVVSKLRELSPVWVEKLAGKR